MLLVICPVRRARALRLGSLLRGYSDVSYHMLYTMSDVLLTSKLLYAKKICYVTALSYLKYDNRNESSFPSKLWLRRITCINMSGRVLHSVHLQIA